MSLRLGLLSTAQINEMILRGAQTTPRVEVVAVASRGRERAERYARLHRLPRAFGSYEGLLDDPGIDAVYISLPNSMHVEWTVRALKAGKHVLCEKPLAQGADDAKRAFEAASRSQRVLAEAFMYRHNPQTTRLADLLSEGAIGQLRLMRSCFRHPTYDKANIRLSAELAGGSLMDLGCYCVNVARLLAGEPERVYGEQTTGPSGAEVAFQGTMRFAGDVVAQIDSSLAAPIRQDLELVGEDGSLRISAPFRVDLGKPGIEVARGDSVQLIEIEQQDSYGLELESFADAAEGRNEALPSAEDSIAQAHVIACLYESARRGRPINPRHPAMGDLSARGGKARNAVQELR